MGNPPQTSLIRGDKVVVEDDVIGVGPEDARNSSEGVVMSDTDYTVERSDGVCSTLRGISDCTLRDDLPGSSISIFAIGGGQYSWTNGAISNCCKQDQAWSLPIFCR